MDKEKRQALKIAAEIMRYFLDHQIEQMNVDFEFSDWANGITVSGDTAEKPHDLEQLTAALKDGRQPERTLNVLFPDKALGTAPDPATGCRRKTRYR